MYNQQTNKIKPPQLDDDIDSFMEKRAKTPAVPKAAPVDDSDVDDFMQKRSSAGVYGKPTLADDKSPVGKPMMWRGPETDASGRETGRMKTFTPPAPQGQFKSPVSMDFRAPTEAQKMADKAIAAAQPQQQPMPRRQTMGQLRRQPTQLALPPETDRRAESQQFLAQLANEKKQQEAAAKAKMEAEAARAPKNTLGKMGSHLVRGAVSGAATTPMRMAAMTDPTSLGRKIFSETAQGIEDKTAEYFPVDRTKPATLNVFKPEFYSMENIGKAATENIPEVVGQMAPQILLSRGAGGLARMAAPELAAATVLPRLSAAMTGGELASRVAGGSLGAVQQAQQAYQNAIAAGMTHEQALQAAAIEAPIGFSEVLGAPGTLGVTRPGAAIRREMKQEGWQEFGQQGATGLSAKYASGYDPNKPLTDIAGEAIGGGALGALTGGIVAAPGAKMQQRAQARQMAGNRAAIDQRSAANAAAVNPVTEPITQTARAAQPATQPLAIAQADSTLDTTTEPLEAAESQPSASPITENMRRRAKLLGMVLPGEPEQALISPGASGAIQPVSPLESHGAAIDQPGVTGQPGTAPLPVQQTASGALRAEADAAKIKAAEFEQAGDFTQAAATHEATHRNLKLLRRKLGTPKTAEDVARLNQIDREVSIAATNMQKAKVQARQMARQANAPAAELSKTANKISEKVQALQPAESAPLLRPEAVQNPEGGIPEMPEQTFTGRLNRGIEQQRAQKPAKPAKRLISRIAELGGISDRYAGELQSVKDAWRVGIVRNRPISSPDILARQLAEDGYDVDPENLDTLWAAIDRDVSGQERTINTDEIGRRLEAEEAEYNAAQEESAPSQQLSPNFDEIVADVDRELPEVTAMREREKLPTVARREALRQAVPKGQYGKISEAAYKNRPNALVEHPQLRRLLGLKEMPVYRLPDAAINPKTGEPYVNPEWTAEAQNTLNMLAKMAGKERSSQISFAEGDLHGKTGQPTRSEMGELFAAVSRVARQEGEKVDPTLRMAFETAVTRARAAQAGYQEFSVDERTENIRQSLYERIRNGELNRKEEAALRTSFKSVAEEYSISDSQADRLFSQTRNEARSRAERTGNKPQPSAAAKPVVAERGERVSGNRESGEQAKTAPRQTQDSLAEIEKMQAWGLITDAEAARKKKALGAQPKINQLVLDEADTLRQEWGILKTFDASDIQGALDNARIQTSVDPANKRAGIIYVNSNAKTVINEIWSSNGGSTLPAAVALDTSALDTIAEVLRHEASFLEGGDAKQVNALADAFSEMVSHKYDGAGLINVDLAEQGFLDLARNHEMFHVWQYGQSQPNDVTRKPMDVEWAKKANGYDKVRDTLLKKGYPDDAEDIVREFAAYAATNDLERLGFAKQEAEAVATDFLYEYFGQISKQYGAEHLERIGRISIPARAVAERVSNEVRSTQTAKGTASESRVGQREDRSARSVAISGISLPGRQETGRRAGSEAADTKATAPNQARTRESVENSPAFKRWFGDSKVVDENGKPLVVYHGTDADFSEFQLPDTAVGAWFSASPDTSSRYANIKGRWKTNGGDNVKPVYLSIKNPAPYDLMDKLRSDAAKNSTSGSDKGKTLREMLIARGYDGVIVDGGDSYIAFKPEQIKSTFNRGTFDPASARIDAISLPERKQPRASFGSLANEPRGQVLAAGLNIQSLFNRKPKAATPVAKDWNAEKWARKFYTDASLNALTPEDRARYSKAKTPKEKNAILMNANLAQDFEDRIFKMVDEATVAFSKGDLQATGEVVAKARELLSGQISDKGRDVNWFDHMRSRLSNVNFKGTYERLAGPQGKEISELFRNAQVDTATGKITRAEAVKRLRRELKPYSRRLNAAGKPGLARWIETHIDAVSDPDQSFRGLAGFLKGFQYNTKLRFNPRSAFVNSLQPLQTLWPHLTTREFAKLQIEAMKPSTRKRVAELAAEESGGSVEGVDDRNKFLRKIDLFSPVSEYNRIVGHLAGELFADRNNLTGDAKARMAADWAKKVEFDNSAYDIPPLFSGKIAGVVGQFKPFMVKNLERIYSDWKSAPPEALATNTWKGAGTLARRSKMIAAQLAIGGVRSAVPGLKMIGGILILGALAKAFSGAGMDDDKAEKLAEAVYFGAPGLIEQDLSGSVMIFDEPFGKNAYEKMVNFFGGPTLSLIAKSFEEGKTINNAEDTKKSTKTEKQQAAGLRLAKSITPLTKSAIALRGLYKGERPELSLEKKVPMTIPEAIGYGLQGTPLRQTKYWEKKETPELAKSVMPEMFPKEESKKSTRVTEDGKIETGTIKRKDGEPEAVYKQRVQRVESWMDEYGGKLINHPRYKALSEDQQKAAIESLRRRIGAQQNLVKPKTAGFEPNAVLLGVKRSQAGKAKRQGKYLYSQP